MILMAEKDPIHYMQVCARLVYYIEVFVDVEILDCFRG